ncbi:hypothetical protein EV645_6435 [Kribbella rubisoli]|uniref:Uncharacterized protein n=1 Tax=Kribbella rubisoli TaxID=3075929 RepID=A0A4Q7WMD5_9ACTN|nr:hypothetical protein EV645_6435 [Kribbella rubisoli]
MRRNRVVRRRRLRTASCECSPDRNALLIISSPRRLLGARLGASTVSTNVGVVTRTRPGDVDGVAVIGQRSGYPPSLCLLCWCASREGTTRGVIRSCCRSRGDLGCNHNVSCGSTSTSIEILHTDSWRCGFGRVGPRCRLRHYAVVRAGVVLRSERGNLGCPAVVRPTAIHRCRGHRDRDAAVRDCGSEDCRAARPGQVAEAEVRRTVAPPGYLRGDVMPGTRTSCSACTRWPEWLLSATYPGTPRQPTPECRTSSVWLLLSAPSRYRRTDHVDCPTGSSLMLRRCRASENRPPARRRARPLV